MATKSTEQLIIELVLKVDKAVAGFANLEKGTQGYNQQLLKTIALMEQLATKAGKTFQQVAGSVTGGSPLLKDLENMRSGVVSEFGSDLDKIPPKQAKVAKGSEDMGKKSQNAAQGFNVLRTAMGFLTAMALSNIFTLFSQGLKKIIDSVTQLQQAFYKLEIAERSISKAGVDITPKELSDIAKEVSNTYKTISRIDSLKMISNLAVLTKDLKLTSEEYRKMALSIPLVAQQAGVSIDSATEQVITGLTKSGRGWADLGITVDAAIIRQEAVNSGLVASAEAYANLTAEQKQQVEVRALLNILEKNTTENLKLQDEYLNSVAGKQALANKQWEDLATLWGETLGPALAAGLGIINTVLETFVAGAERGKKQYVELVSFIQASIWKIDDALSGINTPFSELMDLARSQMNASLAPSPTDTPTVPSIVVDETNNQNLLDAQAKFNQAILDAELKLGQDLEDAKIDYERKLYDIDVEYKAKRLELENDYANKVADINRSYQDKIAEINQRQQEDKAKQRNDELQKEREFQNQMLVLKENFLMALDDALHARDARQILKLIKNYELDKAQAERKNALDKQSAKEDAELRQKSYNEDRKKAEADRKAKLAEAQRDYADKIAKLNADEAAEREAARLANERKIEDLHRSMQDRLEVIAAGLVEEYKLTEENLKGIVGLYLKYYNNATQILAAMRAQIAGTMQMMAQMQSYQYSAPIGPVFGGGNLPSSNNLGGSGGSGGSGTSGRPMANGGTIIANKPTTVTFGERGLEAGTFMPLGRVGKDVNSLFSNVSGAGDSNGRVSIELLLSPDLESRIVSNTLNKTAEVFTRTQRAKR